MLQAYMDKMLAQKRSHSSWTTMASSATAQLQLPEFRSHDEGQQLCNAKKSSGFSKHWKLNPAYADKMHPISLQ